MTRTTVTLSSPWTARPGRLRPGRVRLRHVDVLLRPTTQAAALSRSERPDDPRRRTEDHRTWRSDEPLCYQRVRADDAAIANRGPVENRRAHSNQALIPDVAGVNDRGMADG